MKTIVCKTPEINFYTYLEDWLPIICNAPSKYNFALAEIETNAGQYSLNNWKCTNGIIQYLISGMELVRISSDEKLQFIWGVFSAIPSNLAINNLTVNKDFFIDGNTRLFSNEKTCFIEEATFEIIAFDSSLFILQSDNILLHRILREKYSNAKDISFFLDSK